MSRENLLRNGTECLAEKQSECDSAEGENTGHMEEPEMENSRAAPVHCAAECGKPLWTSGRSWLGLMSPCPGFRCLMENELLC